MVMVAHLGVKALLQHLTGLLMEQCTVTVSNNKFDGHDEVSVNYDVVLIFNKCVNNTEYGCDDDKDFHDSARPASNMPAS